MASSSLAAATAATSLKQVSSGGANKSPTAKPVQDGQAQSKWFEAIDSKDDNFDGCESDERNEAGFEYAVVQREELIDSLSDPETVLTPNHFQAVQELSPYSIVQKVHRFLNLAEQLQTELQNDAGEIDYDHDNKHAVIMSGFSKEYVSLKEHLLKVSQKDSRVEFVLKKCKEIFLNVHKAYEENPTFNKQLNENLILAQQPIMKYPPKIPPLIELSLQYEDLSSSALRAKRDELVRAKVEGGNKKFNANYHDDKDDSQSVAKPSKKGTTVHFKEGNI